MAKVHFLQIEHNKTHKTQCLALKLKTPIDQLEHQEETPGESSTISTEGKHENRENVSEWENLKLTKETDNKKIENDCS